MGITYRVLEAFMGHMRVHDTNLLLAEWMVQSSCGRTCPRAQAGWYGDMSRRILWKCRIPTDAGDNSAPFAYVSRVDQVT